MIEIKQLCKSFEKSVIFDNFNLTVKTGDFAVFSGASGAGKTTLLNMIGSIEPIDSGSICVDGIDITQKKNQINYLKTKVSFLFQNFALIENKTVLENLKIIKGKAKNDVTIEAALAKVGMSDKLHEKVYKLSGGEQQRIALARLMIKKCDIILADEPTGSLDRKNADNVISLLKDLNAIGKTIIMVTHDPNYQNIGNLTIAL